jgi:hypothetical protein
MTEILLKVALNTITTTPNPLLHLKHGKLNKVSCGTFISLLTKRFLPSYGTRIHTKTKNRR